jgi:adenylate kinase family enzyme
VRKFVIMGVQGSGKGTQAKLLSDAFDLDHIGVGDIFSWNVHQARRTRQADDRRRPTRRR